MTTRARWSIGLFLLGTLAPLTLSRPAAAQETCGDKECPKGYACESELDGCPGIACPPDAECPPCEPTPRHYCAPLPCESDADCADGMTCFSRDVTECTGGAPPCARPGDGAGEECPPPEDPECTTTRVSQCVPRWLLPCTADADCGAGFTCRAQERCECEGSGGGGSSGSGSSGSPTPSTPDPAPEADTPDPDPAGGDTPDGCTCEPTDEYACRPVETACSTDAECASGWTCIDNPEGACWSKPDGSTGCDNPDPERLCAPPYYDLIGGGRGLADGEDDGASSAPGSSNGTPPRSTDGDSRDGTKSSSGGCSLTTERGAPGALAVLLAGLALTFARRRAAKR